VINYPFHHIASIFFYSVTEHSHHVNRVPLPPHLAVDNACAVV